ncbi:hypothetical protein [Paenibacillus sp. V4I5]|uniref:hypothetical protein n=1 Tax=Paenibacillus sp. V4I5 TaxID=3042306 RepID=UPI00279326EB|nr:hypothetical protein [Paenibacillus sp. V4I5]MDQ0917547.1 hypothetical protein [Paenibacillus sp. V4I5]
MRDQEEDKETRYDFELWLNHWSDIPWVRNKNHNLYEKLFYDFKLINNYIELDKFINTHGWKIEDWEEAAYLIRDIEFLDALLLILPFKVRRSLLAAIHHYSKKELAKLMGCAESLMTIIFDYQKINDSKEDKLLQLAKLLDVPYWQLKLDYSSEITDNFVEFYDVKSITLTEFKKQVKFVPETRKYLKVNVDQKYYIKNKFIYTQVIHYKDFSIIETMRLQYETDEIYDFSNYCFSANVRYIIVTPAILRRDKKVIYLLIHTNAESKEVITYISKMKKRKFTKIIELNNGSYL